MKTASIIVGVIVLILGIGYFVTNSETEPNQRAQGITQVDTPQYSDDVTTQDTTPDSDTKSAAQTNETKTDNAATTGTYQTYDAKKIAQSNAEHIFLFFHATWCPSCRALDADIASNIDSIPEGVAIYKIDYDTATELKRQYGVTTQHSIIEIDTEGTAKSSITHPLSLNEVIATI